MYYPAQNELWRNTKIDEITNQENNGTTKNWREVDSAKLPSKYTKYTISALKSTNIPADNLYYAGSDPSDTAGSACNKAS
ncbi:MAG: hypothetical protein U5J95_06130 [Balneolaceae bacterium]|nr:hypothetical protein [Balneolaceae bacterium]